ncbi:glycosyltransferase family 2 protein [Nocardioides anomalus]|uniref:Glycosyltransferase family 2 protein n=1 Tax=Nocardioides anomalus TaxID=2712223 RepID=A0A6G6WA34_9ACTN|nr:galactosyltransferase-related protein [Nocardioides anomalus]QIG42094.1 glycosyltransferase family 2 protein [Nocardioides anomalus]
MSRVAVVTLAHGRHEHLAAQHRSLARGSRRPDRYVVVAMDDPSIEPTVRDGLRREVVAVPREPLGLPLAAARNAGVAHALAGGADTVVLLDVDCLAGPDLVAAYAAACATEPATVWSGVVTYLPEPPPGGYDLARLDALDDPHPARPDPGPGHALYGTDPDLFWSLSFAMAASAWGHAGGFCEDYVGYGGEDTDFGHAVVRSGLEHGVLGGARAYHQWHPVSRPPVEHLDDVLRNAALFHERWGRWPMEGWLAAFEERGLAAFRDGRWVATADPIRVQEAS